MSTILKNNSCQKLTTKCRSGNLYDREDRDVIISKLNSKISQLEQQEKEYDLLNQEYKQLENDYILLNEIGTGTFSKVAKAFHIVTDQEVAVKILEKEKIKDVIEK